jgi:chromosome segregation ATPase
MLQGSEKTTTNNQYLQSENDYLKDQIKHLKEEMDTLQHQLEKRADFTRNMKQFYLSNEKELNEISSLLKNKNVQLQNDLNSVKVQNEKLQESIKKEVEERNRMKNSCSALKAEVQGLKAKNMSLGTENEGLKKQNHELLTENSILQERIKTVTEVSDIRKEQVKETINEFNAKINMYEERFKEQNEESRKTKINIEVLTTQVESFKATVGDIKEREELLKIRLKAVEAESEGKNNTILELENEIQKFSDLCEGLRADMNRKTIAAKDQYQSQATELNEFNSQLLTKVQSLEKNIKEKDAMILEIKRHYDQVLKDQLVAKEHQDLELKPKIDETRELESLKLKSFETFGIEIEKGSLEKHIEDLERELGQI